MTRGVWGDLANKMNNSFAGAGNGYFNEGKGNGYKKDKLSGKT